MDTDFAVGGSEKAMPSPKDGEQLARFTRERPSFRLGPMRADLNPEAQTSSPRFQEAQPGSADVTAPEATPDFSEVFGTGTFGFSGRTDQNTLIEVTVAGVTQVVVAAEDGQWAVRFDPRAMRYDLGADTVHIVKSDTEGNTTDLRSGFVLTPDCRDFTVSFAEGNKQARVEARQACRAHDARALHADGISETTQSGQSVGAIDLDGVCTSGSKVDIVFDEHKFAAKVDASGNWTATIPADYLRSGPYSTILSITATDRAGQAETIEHVLQVDTNAADGPVIAARLHEPSNVGGRLYEAGSRAVQYASLDDPTVGPELEHQGYKTIDLTAMELDDLCIEQLELDFPQPTCVVIDVPSLLKLSPVRRELTIFGAGDHKIIIKGGTQAGCTQIDHHMFNTFALGQAGHLFAETGIAVELQ